MEVALELHNAENLMRSRFFCFVKGENWLWCATGTVLRVCYTWFTLYTYAPWYRHYRLYEVTGSEWNCPRASSMKLTWDSHTGLFSVFCSSRCLLGRVASRTSQGDRKAQLHGRGICLLSWCGKCLEGAPLFGGESTARVEVDLYSGVACRREELSWWISLRTPSQEVTGTVA